MRVEEYLDFFGELYEVPPTVRRGRMEEMLKQFDLWETRRLKMGEYSKGMRQKAALIRALIHDPKVLFLDEPTSAMDPYSSRLVRDAISQLKKDNRSIVLCTHNLFEAEVLADYIAIIRKGEIIVEGTSEQLKQRLLGAPAFTVKLVQNIKPQGLPNDLEAVTNITERGPNWFTFSTEEPKMINPFVLRSLVTNGYQVVTISEVSRSLESVYLKIATDDHAENANRDEVEQSLKKVNRERKKLFGKKSSRQNEASEQKQEGK
jgi:ABC-2 type transport system ATP-binding protein